MQASPTAHGDGGLLGQLETRRSVATIALRSPGPDGDQLRRMLAIASRVPDHGALQPWRFIVIDRASREVLSQQMTAKLETMENQAQAEIVIGKEKIRKVFTIAPLIVAVVSAPVSTSSIPAFEQVLSAGAVCMNLILAANAMGFGCNWITGWAAANRAALDTLGILRHEAIAGFILIGSHAGEQPDRPRPALDTIVTYWTPEIGEPMKAQAHE